MCVCLSVPSLKMCKRFLGPVGMVRTLKHQHSPGGGISRRNTYGRLTNITFLRTIGVCNYVQLLATQRVFYDCSELRDLRQTST